VFHFLTKPVAGIVLDFGIKFLVRFNGGGVNQTNAILLQVQGFLKVGKHDLLPACSLCGTSLSA
jgi:hypothetical protein